MDSKNQREIVRLAHIAQVQMVQETLSELDPLIEEAKAQTDILIDQSSLVALAGWVSQAMCRTEGLNEKMTNKAREKHQNVLVRHAEFILPLLRAGVLYGSAITLRNASGESLRVPLENTPGEPRIESEQIGENMPNQ